MAVCCCESFGRAYAIQRSGALVAALNASPVPSASVLAFYAFQAGPERDANL